MLAMTVPMSVPSEASAKPPSSTWRSGRDAPPETAAAVLAPAVAGSTVVLAVAPAPRSRAGMSSTTGARVEAVLPAATPGVRGIARAMGLSAAVPLSLEDWRGFSEGLPGTAPTAASRAGDRKGSMRGVPVPAPADASGKADASTTRVAAGPTVGCGAISVAPCATMGASAAWRGPEGGTHGSRVLPTPHACGSAVLVRHATGATSDVGTRCN